MENENIIPVVEEPVIEKPIVPQVPPEPKEKINLFKIAIVIIGILISLGLFINAYLMLSKKETTTKTSDSSLIVTPTSDPTANWKTYTDSKYSYSIKYPPQWHTNPPPLGPGILIGLNEPNEDQITIDISPTKNAIVASCKPIQLDTVPASRCENTQKITGERGVIYNPPIISKTVSVEGLHNGLYYSISLTFDQTSDKFKLFDQILSTFRFD